MDKTSHASAAGDPVETVTMPSTAIARFFAEKLQFFSQMSTTRANGRAGLVADTAVSLALLIAAGVRHDIHPVAAMAMMLTGLLAFTLIEYCVHRWLFHGSLEIAERGHDKHHQDPLGHDALPFFLPPLGMLALAAVLAACMPVTYAFLLAGGVAAGYAAYGLSHSAIHIFRFRISLMRSWAAAHHIHHHHPNSNFGVTSPLWDIVLGTRYVSSSTKAGQRNEEAEHSGQ